MEPVYTTRDVADEFGVTQQTVWKWLADENIPLQGVKVHPRLLLFSRAELDNLHAYFADNPRRPGRRENPHARYHGWRKADVRRQQPISALRQQAVADGLKALAARTTDRERLFIRIAAFERAPFYPSALLDALGDRFTPDGATLQYTGSHEQTAAAIDRLLTAYEQQR